MCLAEVTESARIREFDDRNPIVIAERAVAIRAIVVAPIRAAKFIVVGDDVVDTTFVDERDSVAGRECQELRIEGKLRASNINNVQLCICWERSNAKERTGASHADCILPAVHKTL